MSYANYKSEAQAFQAIRKHWKHFRNEAQREASYYQWQVEHQDVHPQVKNIVAAIIHKNPDTFHMPLDGDSSRKMHDAQRKVGRYQELLNRFKLND